MKDFTGAERSFHSLWTSDSVLSFRKPFEVIFATTATGSIACLLCSPPARFNGANPQLISR